MLTKGNFHSVAHKNDLEYIYNAIYLSIKGNILVTSNMSLVHPHGPLLIRSRAVQVCWTPQYFIILLFHLDQHPLEKFDCVQDFGQI